jgi:hypothetical protein
MKFSFESSVIYICFNFIKAVNSAPVLLGLGGGHSSSGKGGSNSLAGTSFALDTADAHNTRLHGSSLQIDLNNLEISTSNGKLKMLPDRIEFEHKIGDQWAVISAEEDMTISHNDKVFGSLKATIDDKYDFVMSDVNLNIGDLLLGEAVSKEVTLQLCDAEVGGN